VHNSSAMVTGVPAQQVLVQHYPPQMQARPNRSINGSPHPHFLHVIAPQQQQFHRSPTGSVIASPSIAGPYVHRIDERHIVMGRPNEPEKKLCKSCGTDSSPEWRKGPTGHKT
ncbi:hypothetical protein EC988_008533, partial [Linderina pennispora]